MSRSIFVIANHRTGSSCVAGILHKLGCNMGDTLLGAHRSNPLGHFEDKEVLEFNDSIVGNWKDPVTFEDETLPLEDIEKYQDLVSERDNSNLVWGVKDPRLCITSQFMIPFAEDPRIIVVERENTKSVASLCKRNGFDVLEARGIVIVYENQKEKRLKEFQGIPKLFVNFDSLCIDAESCVDTISSFVFEGYEPPEEYLKMVAASMVMPELRNF